MSDMPDKPDETTTPPWAKNRNGDPRQLLHEAEQLDIMARMRRRDAQKIREQAAACDESANQMERAARDYRQWANERSAGSV